MCFQQKSFSKITHQQRQMLCMAVSLFTIGWEQTTITRASYYYVTGSLHEASENDNETSLIRIRITSKALSIVFLSTDRVDLVTSVYDPDLQPVTLTLKPELCRSRYSKVRAITRTCCFCSCDLNVFSGFFMKIYPPVFEWICSIETNIIKHITCFADAVKWCVHVVAYDCRCCWTSAISSPCRALPLQLCQLLATRITWKYWPTWKSSPTATAQPVGLCTLWTGKTHQNVFWYTVYKTWPIVITFGIYCPE